MSKAVTVEVPVRAYDETLRFINKRRRAAGRKPLSRIPSGRVGTIRTHPLVRAAGKDIFDVRINKHTQQTCNLIHNAGRKGARVAIVRGCR